MRTCVVSIAIRVTRASSVFSFFLFRAFSWGVLGPARAGSTRDVEAKVALLFVSWRPLLPGVLRSAVWATHLRPLRDARQYYSTAAPTARQYCTTSDMSIRTVQQLDRLQAVGIIRFARRLGWVGGGVGQESQAGLCRSYRLVQAARRDKLHACISYKMQATSGTPKRICRGVGSTRRGDIAAFGKLSNTCPPVFCSTARTHVHVRVQQH